MTRQNVRTEDRVRTDAPSDTAVAVGRLVAAGLKALAEFRTLHAHLATPQERAKLETFLFPATGGSGAGCEPKVNAAVGQSPAWIAERAGFSVP